MHATPLLRAGRRDKMSRAAATSRNHQAPDDGRQDDVISATDVGLLPDDHDRTKTEIEALRTEWALGICIRAGEIDLAIEITRDFIRDAARGAAEELPLVSSAVSSAGDLPQVDVVVPRSMGLAKVWAEAGLASSTSEASRKLHRARSGRPQADTDITYRIAPTRRGRLKSAPSRPRREAACG